MTDKRVRSNRIKRHPRTCVKCGKEFLISDDQAAMARMHCSRTCTKKNFDITFGNSPADGKKG